MNNDDKINTHKTQEGGALNPTSNTGTIIGSNDKFNIPAYKEPTNNPMITNEQKRIYNENKPKDQAPPNQLLNLQLYQPPKPKPTNSKGMTVPNPAVFYPNYVPNPFDPIGFANYIQHTGYNVQPAPVYKEYHIDINGVTGSHIKTAMFFEDSLPVKNVSGSFCSIGERITMYESIRANLFSAGDGKDVPIESDKYNLLSHLKLMDMNPYNSSRYSNNPYKGLPFGFLLYRSCYPMRHDNRNYTAMCAPNSTGINVRIYRLTEGSYLVNKQDITKICDHDEWREMAFYNFVKEHIIKKKVCPNFTFMYGYNITTNSNINFDDLKMIQDPLRNDRVTDVSQFTTNWGTNTGTNVSQTTAGRISQGLARLNRQDGAMPVGKIVPVTALVNGRPISQSVNPAQLNQIVSVVRDPVTGLVSKQIMNQPTKADQAIMLNKYTGKALVCLTEASNYNILGWAKKEYRAEGNIKTMINSGYHTRAVWESVIFQLLVALYVMQIKGLVINDFRINRNVFIKDVSTGGAVTSYWKYKVEGIEYYVPNYGYLVLIDTNFRDFDKPCDEQSMVDPSRERKLDGAFLSDCKLSQDECISKTFEMFRTAVDPNIYDQDFVADGGIKPGEEVLRLLTNIKNAADAKPTLSIAHYIRQFMTMFLNNRVGGALTEAEIVHVKKGSIKEFRKGQIVVMTDSDGIDKFVIHVRQRQNGASRIITKDNLNPQLANFIENDVPTSSLNEYSVVEPIKQNFKMNESNLSEESLLETYNVE